VFIQTNVVGAQKLVEDCLDSNEQNTWSRVLPIKLPNRLTLTGQSTFVPIDRKAI
jgi:hypothetical protein